MKTLTDENGKQYKLVPVEDKKEDEPKRWKPELGEEYWVADSFGDIVEWGWMDGDADNYHHQQGNCFKTEKEAESYQEYLDALATIRNSNNGYKWTKGEDNYYLYYSYGYNLPWTWEYDIISCRPNTTYYSTEEEAEAILENKEVMKAYEVVRKYECK